jgi:hypothetical protein
MVEGGLLGPVAVLNRSRFAGRCVLALAEGKKRLGGAQDGS